MSMTKLMLSLITMITLTSAAYADYFPSSGRYCMKISKAEARNFDSAAAAQPAQIRRGDHHTFFAKPKGDDLNGLLVYQVIPQNRRVYQALAELKKGDEFCVMGTYLNRQWPAAILAFDL